MINKQFNIEVKEEFTNITEQIQKEIEDNCLNSGLAFIYSKHTTACIGILEPETLLKSDMKNFLEHLAPSMGYYKHDDIINRDVPPDERRNGYSHLRAMLMNPNALVPVINGKLDLGKWQQIFYIECDLGKEGRTFNLCLIS